ncbi:hypothetical protein J7E62_27610 [Variovorax paradoxus]|nr:hypothetical protein [Variovorax paradoxus]
MPERTSDEKLIAQAQGIARRLTYNDDVPQAEAKHMLHELSHRLGAKCVKVHRRRKGFQLVTAFGQSRYMTWREAILYRLFRVVPDIRPTEQA